MRPTADGNNVDVEYDLSNDKLDKWAEQHGAPPIIVATGFIAKDPKVHFRRVQGFRLTFSRWKSEHLLISTMISHCP